MNDDSDVFSLVKWRNRNTGKYLGFLFVCVLWFNVVGFHVFVGFSPVFLLMEIHEREEKWYF